MTIRENEPLSNHTSIRIGGIAEKYYIPDNVEELIAIIKEHPDYRVLGGGSNLLIRDDCKFPCVIDLRNCCKDYWRESSNVFYFGSSHRIQWIINELKKLDYGGFEFLYSLPALFGGIIYMNSGRGADKQSISSFIMNVRYVDEQGEIHAIDNIDCGFGYRKSVFQDHKWIIIGAKIKCILKPREEIQKEINLRIDYCKKKQDSSCPNFGSAFCQSDGRIMNLIMFVARIHEAAFTRRGVVFSTKTPNWLINKGKGSFIQAKRQLQKVQRLHSLVGKKCAIEVIIWD